MVQRYEQTRKLQWYKRGAAYSSSALTPRIAQPRAVKKARNKHLLKLKKTCHNEFDSVWLAHP